MKLKKLIDALMYRDGGTLESHWLTIDDEEIIVTLEYNHELSDLYGEKIYKLYFGDVSQIKKLKPIDKNNPQCVEFLKAVHVWLLEYNLSIENICNNQDSYGRGGDFLIALEKGVF